MSSTAWCEPHPSDSAQTENALAATFSVGVSNQEAHASISSLLRRADIALYTAKRDGRNRVVKSTGSDRFTITTTLATDHPMVYLRSYRG
ncbi:diguanylate cyclase domain-containing protein [Methylobacterium sp. J-076]|uniref:diguanylate cyclase domain-containing protein n=1 Tax=Methylobacterium sp. J-076 TaxID=2836655 RepID=UPI001FB9F92D|nr:diguanylate cyclase [Methylobacterium sp. J-076]MCJ2012783.1 diguanylate cyclase [Methylobacterium sp. J-076]